MIWKCSPVYKTAREGRGVSEQTHAILILVHCCGCSVQILVTDSFLSVPNLKIKLYPGFLLMIEILSIHTVGVWLFISCVSWTNHTPLRSECLNTVVVTHLLKPGSSSLLFWYCECVLCGWLYSHRRTRTLFCFTFTLTDILSHVLSSLQLWLCYLQLICLSMKPKNGMLRLGHGTDD